MAVSSSLIRVSRETMNGAGSVVYGCAFSHRFSHSHDSPVATQSESEIADPGLSWLKNGLSNPFGPSLSSASIGAQAPGATQRPQARRPPAAGPADCSLANV
jgi:hypothetical protein